MMCLDDKFSLLFDIGKSVCRAYTEFSKSEVQFCQDKSNWASLRSFLLSDDPYEALIHLDLNPVVDVVGYYQLFVGCMLQFPDEPQNLRMKNLLMIIDTQEALDEALKNSRMLRALLAISAKHKLNNHSFFNLFYNSKRILAHTVKKFPDILKMNLMKSKTKTKKLRFTPEEVEMYW